MKSTAPNYEATLHRGGMFFSMLCLAHCILLPPLLALLPLLFKSQLPGWLGESEWVHIALLIPVFLISGPVLFYAARTTKWVPPVAIIALSSLLAALFTHTEWQEQVLTAFGAGLLLTAHWTILRRRMTA